MLAQLNSKQKSIFFNLKPTVIDKLISKNKSSIQNTLLYTNEESDGSVSEDSDASSSSSQECGFVASEHHPTMAPIRRSDKAVVLGSKLSATSQVVLKRKPGRPPKVKTGKGNNKLKVIAAKKLLENSRRGRVGPQDRLSVKDVQLVTKRKRNVPDEPESSKRSRTVIGKRNPVSTIRNPVPTIRSRTNKINATDSVLPTLTRRRPKTVENIKPVETNENKSPIKPETSTLTLLNTKGSPRKFPSNALDRWKSTGMVIRGRGRPRGSIKGTVVRGGIRRTLMRSERYNTRDSQIGLMRSGRRRKLDLNLVENVDFIKRRRKVVRIKKEKGDFPSDEQSSFVTTSELSFCDNDNSLKQSDDEIIKVKSELDDSENETCHSRDTNSNVFHNTKKTRSGVKLYRNRSDTNNRSNVSKSVTSNIVTLGIKNLNRGRKGLGLIDRKIISQSDSSVKDSDCSLDSDFTEDLANSPKSDLKRHRRRRGDGSWVRRSTRALIKNDKDGPDTVVIEELLKDKDFIVDLDSNSKSSSNIDNITHCASSAPSVDDDSVGKTLPELFESSNTMTEIPLEGKQNTYSCIDNSRELCQTPDSLVKGLTESRELCQTPDSLVKGLIEDGSEYNERSIFLESDSLNDFSLTFEETPVKNSIEPLTSEETPTKTLTEPLAKSRLSIDFDSLETLQDQVSVSDSTSLSETRVSEISTGENRLENKFSSTAPIENLPSPITTEESNNMKIQVLPLANEMISKDENISEQQSRGEKKKISQQVSEDSVEVLLDKEKNMSKSNVCNDKERISDETIVSMIDSFCDSSSNDVGDKERSTQDIKISEDLNCEIEGKVVLKCENNAPCVETRLLHENIQQSILVNKQGDCASGEKIEECVQVATDQDSSNIIENSGTNLGTLNNNEHVPDFMRESREEKSISLETVSLQSKSGYETSNNTNFPEDSTVSVSDLVCESKYSVNNSLIVSESINDASNDKFDSADSVNSKSSDTSNDMDINQIYYETNKKMELDNDHAEKVMESTEESSSNDSIVHGSEVTNTNSSQTPEISTHDSLPDDPPDTANVLNTVNNIYTTPQVGAETTDLHRNELNNTTQEGTIREDSESSLLEKLTGDGSIDERPSKELLSALGLQSLHSATEEKPKRPTDSYTGTLKAVIKLNRSDKKSGGRKMIFKQGERLSEDTVGGDRLEYRICSAEEPSMEGVPLTHLADIPAHRKTQLKVKNQFDLSNSPNIVGSAGSLETPTTDSTKEAGGKQNLIIPEKSSSFSIHPERLCTDVCSYCFGKFGSLDTPCHLAQLKNSERQSKILAIEAHLSADSCLCDGCFRYVDRKANCPQASRKPAARRGPLAGTVCVVQDCCQPARHSVRRKWLIKLKKSIGKKLVIDMDKNPHLPFPLCSQHYYWVDYFTVCGICKKRLTRNHMYALGPEAGDLNQALSEDGIPVRLSDKLFLCKLCRYYSSLRLKYRDPQVVTSSHRLFLNSYRKKILHYHDIPVSDSDEEGKSIEDESNNSEMPKTKKKKSKSKSLDGHESKKRDLEKEDKLDPSNEDQSNDSQMIDYSYLETLNVHREEPVTPTGDYNRLEDFEGQVEFNNIASLLNPLEAGQGTVYPTDSQNRSRVEKPTRIQVKFGNLNIGKLSNLNIGQDSRPSSTASSVLERPPFLPGERDLKMAGEFEFHGTLNPSSGWERCTSTIQFDRDTKKLWQELQRPYGNQSSFLRHLVMLEKHWRNGSLVLSENPNPRAAKYITSVQNRVQAYDGARSTMNPMPEKLNHEVTILSPPTRPMSTPPKAPPPLMKIMPGSTPWLHDQLKKPPPYSSTLASTQIMMNKTIPVAVIAPPPYRFPGPRPSLAAPRAIRTPAPSPTFNTIRSQQNIRPVSISYQQFKKIRLERPVSQEASVTVTPKVEPPTDNPTTSSTMSTDGDFAPMICDVRSLANSENDWTESFRKQQQQMLKNTAKYYAPILPKIPSALTVTTFPQTTSLVMKTSSLTIEKAPNVSTKPSPALPEKPSISVFRETTPSENG